MILNSFFIFLINLIIINNLIIGLPALNKFSKKKKINLNCDLRPFNDLHLLNYFLKQQLKKTHLSNEELSRKFYEFRGQIDLNELKNDCEKKSKAKFALIKYNGKNKYEFEKSSSKKNQNHKKISQRMSLELVNALLLGKLLGLNLGMLSSVLFSNIFRPGNGNGGTGSGGTGATTAAPEGGGGGNEGGGDSGGGDTGRFSNYDDNFSSRFNDQEEYCDDQDKINEPLAHRNLDSNDRDDLNVRKDYKRRHKRDIVGNGGKNFMNPIEDNEDLWSNSGGSIYIPTTINRFTPELANTEIQNHNLGNTNFRTASNPVYPLNNNVPFLASSSFAFSEIPIFYNPAAKPKNRKSNPSITTLFHQKNKPSFDIQEEQTDSYTNGKKTNLYPNYDLTNLNNLAGENPDYQDEMDNKKEEIDLNYKNKASKEPQYFDDEFEDELSNKNYDNKFGKDLDREFAIKNFNKNFDKEFNLKKRATNKKHLLSRNNSKTKNRKGHHPSKKRIDRSQLEREDDLDGKDLESRKQLDDTKEQKLVRVTREITFYNKNLFEDKLDIRDLEGENLLDDENDESDQFENSELNDLRSKDENRFKKSRLPKLKRKKRIRNPNKSKKRNRPKGDKSKNTRRRALKKSSKRKVGRKRKATKSLNLVSKK